MIQVIADSLEELPEALRGLATQKDGMYVLSKVPTGYEILANVGGLTSALESEREKASKAEKVLRGFGDITPTQAKEALAKMKEFANGGLDEKAKMAIAEREAQIMEQYEAKLSQAASEADRWKNTTIQEHNRRVADEAIEKNKGNKTLLRPIVLQSLRTSLEENGLKTVIVGPDGTPRVAAKDGKVSDLSAEAFVAELRNIPEYAGAFEGTGNSGGGSSGGGRTPGESSMGDIKDPSERLRQIRSK